MYIPVSLGLFTIFTLLMVVVGNLITTYKIYKKSIEHAEKCGCCGKKEEKKESGIDIAGAVDTAKKVASGVSKLV